MNPNTLSKIEKVVKSCKTVEQLENTKNWITDIFKREYKIDESSVGYCEYNPTKYNSMAQMESQILYNLHHTINISISMIKTQKRIDELEARLKLYK